MKALLRIISVVTVLVLGLCSQAQTLAETVEEVQATLDGRIRYNKVLLKKVEAQKYDEYYSCWFENDVPELQFLPTGKEAEMVKQDIKGLLSLYVMASKIPLVGDQLKEVNALYLCLGFGEVSGRVCMENCVSRTS